MTEREPRMFIDAQGRSVLLTFGLVSSLFLLWGFCNGLIDVMDKHFQEQLHLSLAQSAWVQFAHYLGYFLMALPAGAVAAKLGFKGGIIAGLILVATGGFWFLVATQITAFWGFLIGVCVIASGLAFLETIANPYSTVLGAKRYAAMRINLAQACNGIGWVLGPIAGAQFFYSADAHGRSTGSETLYIPYVGVAVICLILAAIFFYAYVPDVITQDEYGSTKAGTGAAASIWSHPHFVMAVVAQFLYVAAQAGIFSYFINYLTSQVPVIPGEWKEDLSRFGSHVGILHSWLGGWFRSSNAGALSISDKGASNLASLAFVIFLIGRVTGAALLRRFPPSRILALYAGMNVLMSALIFAKLGWLSVACLFLCYLFMSIMFPTIFALGIHGLGERTKRASAYLVMAIVGGAIVPKLMGYIADHSDMSRGFIVPTVCFAFVAYFGLRWPSYSRASGAEGGPRPVCDAGGAQL